MRVLFKRAVASGVIFISLFNTVVAHDTNDDSAVINRPAYGAPGKLKRVQAQIEPAARRLPVGLPMHVKTAQARGMNKAAASFSASISVEGMGESVTYFQENFNGGAIPAGWEIAATENVTWEVSKPSGTEIFTEDTADNGSLVQDTPYQVFKREKSWVVSPEFTVGRNALLEFWVGCTLNWEDMCSLKAQISDDNFATFTDVWFSREQTGDKPWQWRKIQASLAAFAGKTIKLRFFYGSGTNDDIFDSGGYMGDYRIDNIRVYGPGTVKKVELTTGERVRFIADTDAPDDAVFVWSFPGAVPSESTEPAPEVYYTADGNYDVSLSVTYGTETATDTRSALVHVTGVEPTAAIGYPATFRRNESGRKIMVAPLMPVKYTDNSKGYPTGWNWSFSGVHDDSEQTICFDTPEAEVSYKYLHEWPVSVEVHNIHGSSTASGSVVAEYEGNITNLLPGETGTVFDLEGSGTFPGSNTMGITAYAERFSAPSRPMRAYGAYVFFTKAEATSVYYQLQNIKVKICKADENGLPGEELDWGSWAVFELETPSGTTATGTGFEFSKAPVIDCDFFIVVEGIPALVDNYDEKCDVRMAMAPFRTESNTAYLLQNGKWTTCDKYFPAPANHTSYMIMVNMAHSVICNLPGTENIYNVPAEAGETTLALYSYMGWDAELSGADMPWLHIASAPGGMTVDNVKITYDASTSSEPREGHVTFSDGASSHSFTVVQSGVSAIKITDDNGILLSYDRASRCLTVNGADAAVYNVSGSKVAEAPCGTTSLEALAPGIYIARSMYATLKFVK